MTHNDVFYLTWVKNDHEMMMRSPKGDLLQFETPLDNAGAHKHLN